MIIIIIVIVIIRFKSLFVVILFYHYKIDTVNRHNGYELIVYLHLIAIGRIIN